VGRQVDEFAREDLLAELIGYCWELSRRYDPDTDRRISQDRGRRSGFDGWASIYLRFKVIDWIRKTEGRTTWKFADGSYDRVLPTFVSFDDGLDEAQQPRGLDPSERSDPDLGRVLLRGDSDEAWDAAGVDREDDGRVEERAA
jgi:hypothetical protein